VQKGTLPVKKEERGGGVQSVFLGGERAQKKHNPLPRLVLPKTVMKGRQKRKETQEIELGIKTQLKGRGD